MNILRIALTLFFCLPYLNIVAAENNSASSKDSREIIKNTTYTLDYMLARDKQIQNVLIARDKKTPNEKQYLENILKLDRPLSDGPLPKEYVKGLSEYQQKTTPTIAIMADIINNEMRPKIEAVEQCKALYEVSSAKFIVSRAQHQNACNPSHLQIIKESIAKKTNNNPLALKIAECRYKSDQKQYHEEAKKHNDDSIFYKSQIQKHKQHLKSMIKEFQTEEKIINDTLKLYENRYSIIRPPQHQQISHQNRPSSHLSPRVKIKKEFKK